MEGESVTDSLFYGFPDYGQSINNVVNSSCKGECYNECFQNKQNKQFHSNE